jgi:hypothetical protein
VSFIGAVATRVASSLDFDPDHVAAAIVAGVNSARITGAGLFLGLSVDAYSQGATTPDQIVAYYKAHWVAWAFVNVIVPWWRASSAYRKAATASAVAAASAGDGNPPTSPAASPDQKGS